VTQASESVVGDTFSSGPLLPAARKDTRVPGLSATSLSRPKKESRLDREILVFRGDELERERERERERDYLLPGYNRSLLMKILLRRRGAPVNAKPFVM
jgi:hypothetical protein